MKQYKNKKAWIATFFLLSVSFVEAGCGSGNSATTTLPVAGGTLATAATTCPAGQIFTTQNVCGTQCSVGTNTGYTNGYGYTGYNNGYSTGAIGGLVNGVCYPQSTAATTTGVCSSGMVWVAQYNQCGTIMQTNGASSYACVGGNAGECAWVSATTTTTGATACGAYTPATCAAAGGYCSNPYGNGYNCYPYNGAI